MKHDLLWFRWYTSTVFYIARYRGRLHMRKINKMYLDKTALSFALTALSQTTRPHITIKYLSISKRLCSIETISFYTCSLGNISYPLRSHEYFILFLCFSIGFHFNTSTLFSFSRLMFCCSFEIPFGKRIEILS